MLFTVLVLSACGADAPPEPFEDSPLRVDASATVGVTAEF